MSHSDDDPCTCGHARWPFHSGPANETGRCTLGTCSCQNFESARDTALLASVADLKDEFELLMLDHRLPGIVALAESPLPPDPGTFFPHLRRPRGFFIDLQRRQVRDANG